MGNDVQLLRAMLRLARRRQVADLEALRARVEGAPADVREGLRRLAAQGLVERAGDGGRLTMAGLAVAVACVASKARGSRAVKRSSRTRAA